MPDLSWKEAITKVLSEAAEPLHYRTIAEEIAKQSLRKNLGATPESTVNAIITVSMNKDGEASPYVRTNAGYYLLKINLEKPAESTFKSEVVSEPLEKKNIVKCVGMFWHHSKIIWKTTPRLLGQQVQGSKEIDFCQQIGVYLLYDRSRVIYVGRAIDRGMGIRLSEHTRDRLNGRWDRFSWFGLRGASDSGELTETNFTADVANVVSLMEAVLIESLEPPQNRRRGDDFSNLEYLQITDKEKSALKTKALISMIQDEMGAAD